MEKVDHMLSCNKYFFCDQQKARSLVSWLGGTRQEDTLSPFLLTSMMDGLSCFISRGVASGLIKGVKVGLEGTVLSHLQFAHDTILFLENDNNSFSNALSLLQIFKISFGLKINLSKSSLAATNSSIFYRFFGRLSNFEVSYSLLWCSFGWYFQIYFFLRSYCGKHF